MHLSNLLFALLITLFVSTNLIAQEKQAATITEKEVSRILKTLSSDQMQGRKVFTPGIDKAGTFIEQEFKKTGLQYYPGLQTYQQPFVVYQMLPLSRQATINGKKLASDAIAVAANMAFERLEWSDGQQNQPRLFYIRANDDFTSLADSIAVKQKRNDGLKDNMQDLIVLIDTAHRAKFSRMKPYLEKFTSKILKGTSSILFLLTEEQKVSTYQINLVNQIKQQTLYNVIGVLPGKSRSKEMVLFAAHYDHMGIADKVDGNVIKGDSIMNGANDDASGTTAVLLLAQHFKAQNKNERTLVFVAFTFEERGGYGSKFFANTVEADKVVAMFNIEMIGRTTEDRKKQGGITGVSRSNFAQLVNKSLSGYDFRFDCDSAKLEDFFFRSDNIRLARLGVPAHTITGGQGADDPFYHSVDDEFDSIDIPYTTNLINAIAIGAQAIISGKETPTRIDLNRLE